MAETAQAPQHRVHRSAADVVRWLPGLATLWTCSFALAAGVLVVLGQVLGTPFAVLGTGIAVALTWALWPQVRSTAPRSVWPSVVILAYCASWFLVNSRFVSEQLIASRDSSVLALASLWMVESRSAAITAGGGGWEAPGFERGEDGLVRSQNTHTLPALAGLVGRVLGRDHVLLTNLMLGAVVLVALYVLSRRFVGDWWSLLPPVVLSLGLPFLYVTRSMFVEPLTSLFVLTGAAFLLATGRDARGAPLLASGLLLGSACLIRIDGVVVLLGVPLFLALRAVLPAAGGLHAPAAEAGVPRIGRRLSTVLLPAVGAVVPVTLGYVDIRLWSTRSYYRALGDDYLVTLAGGLVVVALSCVVVALPPLRLRASLARSAPGVAGVAAALVLVMLSAPAWYEGRHIPPLGPFTGEVAALQLANGLAVDPLRSYDELALVSLSWYHGWALLALGAFGLAWLVLHGLRGRSDLLALPALASPLMLVYSYNTRITPDQLWASRRLSHTVLPILILVAVYLVSQLCAREDMLVRGTGGVLALSMVLAPLPGLRDVGAVREDGGGMALAEQLCEVSEGRRVVVVGLGTTIVVPALAIYCGRVVEVVEEMHPGALLPYTDASDPWLVIAPVGTDLPWVGEAPAPQVDVSLTRIERTLLRRPVTDVEVPLQFVVGLIRRNGTVVELL